MDAKLDVDEAVDAGVELSATDSLVAELCAKLRIRDLSSAGAWRFAKEGDAHGTILFFRDPIST